MSRRVGKWWRDLEQECAAYDRTQAAATGDAWIAWRIGDGFDGDPLAPYDAGARHAKALEIDVILMQMAVNRRARRFAAVEHALLSISLRPT